MKFNYGACIGGKDLAKIKTLAGLGYDFVETGFSALDTLTDEDIGAFDATLRENGLSCVSCNGFMPGTLKTVGPEVDDGAIKDFLARTFERSAKLGFKSLIFGSGASRRVPDGYPRAKAKADLIHFLGDLALPYAKKYGIVIGIEELRSEETNIINTCGEAMEYIREIDDPNLRLLVDLYHVACMGDSVETLHDYKGYVSHVHIASPSNKRVYPLPTDGDDALYRRFFEVLDEIGYEARNISLEGSVGDAFDVTVSASLPYLKSLES